MIIRRNPIPSTKCYQSGASEFSPQEGVIRVSVKFLLNEFIPSNQVAFESYFLDILSHNMLFQYNFYIRSYWSEKKWLLLVRSSRATGSNTNTGRYLGDTTWTDIADITLFKIFRFFPCNARLYLKNWRTQCPKFLPVGHKCRNFKFKHAFYKVAVLYLLAKILSIFHIPPEYSETATTRF